MLRAVVFVLCLSSAAAFSVAPALRARSAKAASARNAASSVASNLKMSESSEMSRRRALAALAGFAMGTLPSPKPAQAEDSNEIDIYIGAGCFWHVQVTAKHFSNSEEKSSTTEFSCSHLDDSFALLQPSQINLGTRRAARGYGGRTQDPGALAFPIHSCGRIRWRKPSWEKRQGEDESLSCMACNTVTFALFLGSRYSSHDANRFATIIWCLSLIMDDWGMERLYPSALPPTRSRKLPRCLWEGCMSMGLELILRWARI